jgi:bifunctional non-homologous end joining protein LigD
MPRLTFIRPLSPSAAVRPPIGDDWLHEPKWDGFRFQIIKDGSRVRFYSRHGAEYADRLPRMIEAFDKLPTQSTILDGELVLIDPRGSAHFYRLMAQMRTSHPDEGQLFVAFDLLHQDGVDLRILPLTERKRGLHRLCRKSRVPFMREVQTFPNGKLLFDHCSKFGFEGVVSKRRASRYSGGPSRNWVKSKCPGWKRINSERYRLFEGPLRKPELTEARRTLAKKRQELARVVERLRSPPLSHGIARELRKQQSILEGEIAELEK